MDFTTSLIVGYLFLTMIFYVMFLRPDKKVPSFDIAAWVFLAGIVTIVVMYFTESGMWVLFVHMLLWLTLTYFLARTSIYVLELYTAIKKLNTNKK